MKRDNSIFTGWLGVQHQLSLVSRLTGAGLAIVVIVAGLAGPAYCQTNSTALLLQQTPAQGGEISLGVGVHHFALNTEVTLTAVPKHGYQFAYWLGDVSEPTARTTIVYLDAPKIIIAIFERLEFELELLAVEERAQSRPGGGLRRSGADYTRRGFSGGGGRRPPPEWRWPEWPEPKISDDFPAPKDANDFPVPVPEPATGVLLALGSLFTFTRRRGHRPDRRLS